MVVGADFSQVALDKAKELSQERGLTNISWQRQNILAIDHPDSSFDSVFSFETIEHVHSPLQAVRELARVLKPEGRLFLTTPNYIGLMGLYRAYLYCRGRDYSEVGQPINRLTTFPVTASWLWAAGLRICRLDSSGHYLPFPKRPPIRLPLLDSCHAMIPIGLHSFFLAQKI